MLSTSLQSESKYLTCTWIQWVNTIQGEKLLISTVVKGSNFRAPRMYVRGVLWFLGAWMASSLVTGLRTDVIRFLAGATDFPSEKRRPAFGSKQAPFLFEIIGYLPSNRATCECSWPLPTTQYRGWERVELYLHCPIYDLNRLTPNDPYMGLTAPLTSKRCILYIYSTNVSTEYFKHVLCSLFFFSSKCSLFHNTNLFGSCIIHILYTGCAKIKKNNSGAKGLIGCLIKHRDNFTFAFSLCFCYGETTV